MRVPNNNPANITNWDLEEGVLESEYGKISYLDWCYREAERLKGSYSALHVARADGYCAILRGAQ